MKTPKIITSLLCMFVTLSSFGQKEVNRTKSMNPFVKQILYPVRKTLKKNPADYGLEYKNVTFYSADSINLKGWLIEGSLDKTIIITHPGNFNRYGWALDEQGRYQMADKEVEFLKTASVLNKQGYSVLMFDFRNHGVSESSFDGEFGLGLYEFQDVVAAVNFIKNGDIEYLRNDEIGIFACCMGANSTIIALNRAKNEMTAVKAVMLVQPVAYDVFLRNYASKPVYLSGFMVPNFMLEKAIKRINKREGKPNVQEMSPANDANGVNIPVLLVQEKHDPWTDLKQVEKIYNKIASEDKTFLWLENNKGRFYSYHVFGEESHSMHMIKFFKDKFN